MFNTTTRIGCYAGQICTVDYDRFRDWASEEDFEFPTALTIFVEYASNHLRRKTLNTRISSYSWKHEVEHLSKKLAQKYPHYQAEYISNELFVVAMLQSGFNIKNTRSTSYSPGPNYYLNIGELPRDWVNRIVERVVL